MAATDFFDNVAVNILIHALLLFAFLCGFFYLYISGIVDKHISDEVVSEAETLIKGKYNRLSQIDRTRMSVLLQSMPLESLHKMYSKPDDVKLENNYFNKLCAVIVIAALTCVVGVIIITYTFRCNRNIDLGHILVENAVVFFFVALVELAFFMYIASKYIPVLPSSIMEDMVQRIKANMAALS